MDRKTNLMRTARVQRTTKETSISVEVNLDGDGRYQVDCKIGFLKHMIELLSAHSLIDVRLNASGDLVHHIVEDTALALGDAIHHALGERKGIMRFGWALAPLDEALSYASVDLAKRPYAVAELKIEKEGVEDLPREDIYHFIRSLAMGMQANLHVMTQYGENDHHKTETGLKALALSLRQAIASDPRRAGVPSSKGAM